MSQIPLSTLSAVGSLVAVAILFMWGNVRPTVATGAAAASGGGGGSNVSAAATGAAAASGVGGGCHHDGSSSGEWRQRRVERAGCRHDGGSSGEWRQWRVKRVGCRRDGGSSGEWRQRRVERTTCGSLLVVDDVGADCGEKARVVGFDEHSRVRLLAQAVDGPFHRPVVEVVSGLVQEHDVRRYKTAARELHAPAPAQRAHGPQQLVVVEAQILVQVGLELGRVAPDEHGVGQDDVEHGGGDGLLVVKVTGRRKMCVLCSSTLHLGSQVPLYLEFEPPHAVGLRLLSRARARAEEFARALGLVGLGIWRQEAAEVGLHAGPPRLGRQADVARQVWSRV
jgi:hypothetical protein